MFCWYWQMSGGCCLIAAVVLCPCFCPCDGGCKQHILDKLITNLEWWNMAERVQFACVSKCFESQKIENWKCAKHNSRFRFVFLMQCFHKYFNFVNDFLVFEKVKFHIMDQGLENAMNIIAANTKKAPAFTGKWWLIYWV